MKRVMGLWIWFAAVMPCLAGTVPNQITYQGTITEKGAPVTGTRTMLFRITDSVGTNPGYWSSGNIDIAVNAGLFSTVLSPTGVPWQDITPYIELSVGPQGQTPKLMLPRETITATAYSLMSGTVIDGGITTSKIADASVTTAKLADQSVTNTQLAANAVRTANLAVNAVTTAQVTDGSITLSKLDPGVQGVTVPAGLIALFASNCPPTGWTRFAGLNGSFPRGADLGALGGGTGGAAKHNHGGRTGVEPHNNNSDAGNGSPTFAEHSHTIADASNIPPYLDVVFCQKL